jgi:hypothetical protein
MFFAPRISLAHRYPLARLAFLLVGVMALPALRAHAQLPVIPGLSSKVDNANFSCTFPAGWMVLSIPGVPSSDSSGVAFDTTKGGVFMGLQPDNGSVDPNQIPEDAVGQIPEGSTSQLISTSTKKIGSYTWSISLWEWVNEKGEKYRGQVYFCRVKSGAYMSVVAVPSTPTVNITALVADAETALATLAVTGGSFLRAGLKERIPSASRASRPVDAMGRTYGLVRYPTSRLLWQP